MSEIKHWIGVRMAAGYDDEDFRDLLRMVNTMRSVAEAVVVESAEVPQPVEADRAVPMSLIEQCDTLITLIRHGVEAWRDGDGDANTAHVTLSNIEQLDKRVHQLAGRETALQQLPRAVEALRVADNLLRQFSISAYDHSELIRREFGKAQRQINDALSGEQ